MAIAALNGKRRQDLDSDRRYLYDQADSIPRLNKSTSRGPYTERVSKNSTQRTLYDQDKTVPRLTGKTNTSVSYDSLSGTKATGTGSKTGTNNGGGRTLERSVLTTSGSPSGNSGALAMTVAPLRRSRTESSIGDAAAGEIYSKPEYSSRYASQIDALLDSVLNREGFSYDLESDPLYQQYRKQYIREGDRAMRDTMGNAAALTGGYGSSYGTTAGSQAYDYYLSQLNDRVPELEQQAYQRWQDEGTALLNRLSLLQSLEDTDYSRYRDDVGDYYTDRNFDYQKGQDALSQRNWQNQFDYQKEQDALSQRNWQAQFDYQKAQDAQEQKNWLMNYYASLSKGSGSGSSGSGTGKTTHSEMYSNVLKRAEKQLDGGKKTEQEVAQYVLLNQSITDEEAYDILNYLGLGGALDQETRKKTSGSSGTSRLLSGAGGKNTMRTY